MAPILRAACMIETTRSSSCRTTRPCRPGGRRARAARGPGDSPARSAPGSVSCGDRQPGPIVDHGGLLGRLAGVVGEHVEGGHQWSFGGASRRGRCRGRAARRRPAWRCGSRPRRAGHSPTRARAPSAAWKSARAAASTSTSRARSPRARPASSSSASSPMRAVVEQQHAARHARLRIARRADRDHGQIGGLREQLVLRVEEAADALARRVAARIGAAEARPGLLLEVGQLLDQQLFLAADVAVDRARAHPGALGDRAQRRAVEAALAEERRAASRMRTRLRRPRSRRPSSSRSAAGRAGGVGGWVCIKANKIAYPQTRSPGPIARASANRGKSRARNTKARLERDAPARPSDASSPFPDQARRSHLAARRPTRARGREATADSIRNIRARSARSRKSLISLGFPAGNRAPEENLFRARGSRLPGGKRSAPDRPRR